jgi:hypothetical protein
MSKPQLGNPSHFAEVLFAGIWTTSGPKEAEITEFF